MKFATISKVLVLGFAVLLASSTFAASKADMTLINPASVNGTQLKPGDYKLEWDGTGPNVELTILQGKKVLAKVPARLVDLQAPAQNNAAVLKKGDNGTSTLAGARFAGKKYALEVGESGDSMQSGSSK